MIGLTDEQITELEHREKVLSLQKGIEEEKQAVQNIQAQNRFNMVKQQTKHIPIKELEKINVGGKLDQVIVDRKADEKASDKLSDALAEQKINQLTGTTTLERETAKETAKDISKEVAKTNDEQSQGQVGLTDEQIAELEFKEKSLGERLGQRVGRAKELTKEAFDEEGILPIPSQRKLLGAEAEIARAVQEITASAVQKVTEPVIEAGKVVGEKISEITPDIIEESAKTVVGKIVKTVGGHYLKNPGVQLGMKAIVSGSEAYSDFKEKYPEEASILEDIGAVSSVLPFAVGAGRFIGKMAKPVVKAGRIVSKGIVKPLVYTVGKTKELTPRAIAGVGRAIEGATPIQILKDRISPSQAKILLKKLKDVGDDSISLLPDIGGEEIRGLTRATARVPGGAKEIIGGKLNLRSIRANKRINDSLNMFLSNDEFFGNLDDLISTRQQLAAPFYEEAAGKAVIDKRIGIIIRDKRFQKALKKAKDEFNLNPDIAENSVEALDAVKKVFDDTINSAIKTGENQRARAFIKFKNGMLDIVDKNIPEYKTARSIFSDYSKLEDAQKVGLGFRSQRPEQLKRVINTYQTEGEKAAFRLGVKEKLREIVDKTPEGADPAKRIFGNPEIRNSLKQIFREKEYNVFQRKMLEEIRGARTKFDVLGGSRTDFNMVDLGKGMKDAKDIAKSPRISTVIDKSLGKIFESLEERFMGLDPETAKELAKILTDRKASIKALKEISKG